MDDKPQTLTYRELYTTFLIFLVVATVIDVIMGRTAGQIWIGLSHVSSFILAMWLGQMWGGESK